ncbi:MAG TPA: hypothetical protein V6C76_14415 [Drouetiella sp.]
MLDDRTPTQESNDAIAADPNLTRKVFLNKVVKGAALTGGLAVAPKVLDKFLVQSVAACTPPATGCNSPQGATASSGSNDTFTTAPCSDVNANLGAGNTTFTAQLLVAGGDTLNCCGDNGTVNGGTGGGTDALDCKN